MDTRALLALAFVLTGCNSAPAEPSPVDAGLRLHDAGAPTAVDAGGLDAQPPPCFTNPTTYLEIINACTDAQAVDKEVDLSPMNLADGGLQPLP